MSQSSRQGPISEEGPWPQPSIRSTQTSYHEQTAAPLKSGDIEADLSAGLVEQDPNARPKCFRNLFEEVIFIFTVMMAVSCTTFIQGVTVINTATIGRSLHMSPAEITWISAAIGLGSGSFMLMFGKTADLFGCKPQLLVGMLWLAAWSLGTAFAPAAIPLNVFCGMLGIGTALISPPAIGTMFATYPEGKRRNLATGALGSSNPIGFILGSMSSGLMTRYFNWRASFIFLSVFFFIATLLAIWTMPSIPRRGSIKEDVHKFDYLGTILTVTGIGLISFALTEGPQNGWNSPHFIASLVIGLVCVLSFAFWETICKHPLLNPAVWKNKNFTLCVLAVMFGYGSFSTSQFWLSLYLQKIQRLSGIHIAVQLMTQAISGVVWSYTGQYLVPRIHGTILMSIGGLGYFTGTFLLTFIDIDTPYWRFLFPSLIITVIGADFQFIVSNLFVNKHMSSQAALGAGVLQTAMRLSISLGLAISTAVFGAVQNAQTPNLMLTDPRTTLPYHRALLCASMFAAVGLLFIPFMRINTKAVSPPPLPTFPPTFIEPALHALDPLQEDRDPEKKPGNQSQRNDKDIPNSDFSQGPNGKVSEYPFYHTKHTNSSFQSAYTYDSASTTGKHEVSFFPRWSWEDSNGSGGPVGFDDSVQGAFWPKVLDARQRGRKRNGHGMRGKLGNGNVFSRSRVEEDIVLYEVCVNCLQERRVLLRGGESSFGFGFGLGDGRDLLHPPDAHTRGRNRRT